MRCPCITFAAESGMTGSVHECWGQIRPGFTGMARRPASSEALRQGAATIQGASPFELDEQALAALAPGLVLTQDACATCDADAGIVAAALERAGLAGSDARAPAYVLTMAPHTLAQALDSILEASHTFTPANPAPPLPLSLCQ